MPTPPRRDVTVAIPTIPIRGELVARAVRSAVTQTLPPVAVSIAVDLDHDGAGPTRTRAMEPIRTTWTAFLDDDDELLVEHLQALVETAQLHDADVVWPWYHVIGGGDPLPHEGRQWNPADPHLFPITALVRTETWRDAGASFGAPAEGDWIAGEDWHFWLALNAAGARFLHVNARTWLWHHDSGNTSGRGDRWRDDGSVQSPAGLWYEP